MGALEQRSDQGGYPLWAPADPGQGIAFVGRGDERPREEVLAAVSGIHLAVSWLRQVHAADCVEALPGCAGEGDALTTQRGDLALVISTADCVPLLLRSHDRVTAAHAGWKGIVAGVVRRAVETFDRDAPLPAAWIGPAIGVCCYEVGSEVAEPVVAACSDPEVLRYPPGASRVHLDLRRAVASQLREAGVLSVTSTAVCTRCDPRLHSYRRDGSAAGRNLAFGWLSSR